MAINKKQDDLFMLAIDRARLEQMSHQERMELAKQVLSDLDDVRIEMIPEENRKLLNIKREGFFGGCSTWIALILSALVGTIVAEMLGH